MQGGYSFFVKKKVLYPESRKYDVAKALSLGANMFFIYEGLTVYI